MFVRKKEIKLVKIAILSLFLFSLIGQFCLSYPDRETNTIIKSRVERLNKQENFPIVTTHFPKQETGMYISFGENVDNSTIKEHISSENMLLNLTIEAKDENYLKNISIFYNNKHFVVIGENAISIDNEDMFRNSTYFRHNASFFLLYEELETEGVYNITVQIFNGRDKALCKKLLFTLLLPTIDITDPSEFSQVDKSFNLEWSVTHEEIVDYAVIYINEEFYNNVTSTSTEVTLPVDQEEEHLEEKYYYFTIQVKVFTLDGFFNYSSITVIYVSPPSEPTRNPIEIDPRFYVLISIIGLGVIGSVVYFIFRLIKKKPFSISSQVKTTHLASSSLKKKEKNEPKQKEAKKIVSDLRKKRR